MSTQFENDFYRQFIHVSRYARWLPEEKRRETWTETVARYFGFFDNHLKTQHNYTIPADLRKELMTAVLRQDIMPSMRCLMTAGDALQKENIAGYNCSYVAVDSPRSFDEILYILMNGCFAPDTLIKTRLGDKRIDTLDPTDEVLSYNMETGQYEYVNPAWVIPTPHSAEKTKLELQFEDGSVIQCTEDHEFFTNNRGWVKAKDLTEDDDVKNYHEI